MRGSLHSQITGIWKQSGINQIGESRHLHKQEAREIGARGAHEIGQNVGISSYNTAKAYLSTWHQLADYVRSEHKLRDIERLEPEMVREFLAAKAEIGCSWQTLTGDGAALNKLAVALTQYSERMAERFNREAAVYNFRDMVDSARDAYRDILDRFTDSRQYQNPNILFDSFKDPGHRLAAHIQLEGGTRIHEASLIKTDQLRGLGNDKFTGRDVGLVQIQGKGGKTITVKISCHTYRELEMHIAQDGHFKIDKDSYRTDLKHAAHSSGQRYSGSHGLRWNFAQNRMEELQKNGVRFEQALAVVSTEMGHERVSITKHYLGSK